MFKDLPHLDKALFAQPSSSAMQAFRPSAHAPRILLLYGSVRDRSYSRLLSEEAARLLQAMGAETKTFDPRGLPLPDERHNPLSSNCHQTDMIT